jgi:hypothetical protein
MVPLDNNPIVGEVSVGGLLECGERKGAIKIRKRE